MENKVPPQNMEAEQAIIGGLLLDPSAWDEVAELVAEEEFYKPSHRRIFPVSKR